jgi:hypothetical protein
MPDIQQLSPPEELEYLREIYGEDQHDRLYEVLTDAFNVLQNRAQMLLSLITITLTITGFSGPGIAASGPVGRWSIIFGLVLVLLSALILITGPLRLNWGTNWKSSTVEQSLIRLIHQRNFRTNRYHLASITLVLGMIGYVASVVSFLMTG